MLRPCHHLKVGVTVRQIQSDVTCRNQHLEVCRNVQMCDVVVKRPQRTLQNACVRRAVTVVVSLRGCPRCPCREKHMETRPLGMARSYRLTTRGGIANGAESGKIRQVCVWGAPPCPHPAPVRRGESYWS
jgi:hypothetical protein